MAGGVGINVLSLGLKSKKVVAEAMVLYLWFEDDLLNVRGANIGGRRVEEVVGADVQMVRPSPRRWWQRDWYLKAAAISTREAVQNTRLAIDSLGIMWCRKRNFVLVANCLFQRLVQLLLLP
jgi:hypothetical protein